MPLATVINGGEFFYKPETWPIKKISSKKLELTSAPSRT